MEVAAAFGSEGEPATTGALSVASNGQYPAMLQAARERPGRLKASKGKRLSWPRFAAEVADYPRALAPGGAVLDDPVFH